MVLLATKETVVHSVLFNTLDSLNPIQTTGQTTQNIN